MEIKYRVSPMKNKVRYYFEQPPYCYCEMTERCQEGDIATKKKVLQEGYICSYCSLVTEKLAKKEETIEENVIRDRGYINWKDEKVKTLELSWG